VAADETWIEELASDFDFLIEDEDSYRFPRPDDENHSGLSESFPNKSFEPFLSDLLMTENMGLELDVYESSRGDTIYIEAKSGKVTAQDVVEKVVRYRAYTAASHNVSGKEVVVVLGEPSKAEKVDETVSKMNNVTTYVYPK
jgi:hypothetical protein